ncbi:MAG: cysteine--tRNA ligase [Nocardioides sp.]
MAASRMSSGVVEARRRVGPTPRPPEFLVLDGRRLPVVGSARVYVCGITPYDVTHLGHAATFVWADVLSTVLGTSAATVIVCRNVTDVDDVLLSAAKDRGVHYDRFALTQEALFERSMSALRVARPAAEPRARHHVDAVQHLAQALLDRDAAYERDGSVWFRGDRTLAQVRLSRDEALELSAAYGDDPGDPTKDDPFDVAVWRPSADGTPAWASPWGWGRPGWHAECAAMALDVHGASVDVLAGGADLRFPHHAYQAAMVSAATGVAPFARSQLHVGEVRISGAKMAKSAGNLVLVDELLRSATPAALRLLLLSRRYTEPWDFTADTLAEAEARLRRLHAAAAAPAGIGPGEPDEILAALRADLDVPRALALAEERGGEAARRAITLLKLA